MAEAVVRAHLPGPPRLRYVDFSVDFRCNLRCAHCFATSLQAPGRRTMTPADYARVARQAMDLGAVNFSFQGGEPLMFGELPAILAACRPDRNLISVSTNGTLLDEARVRDLASWGVDILTVSLDSAVPAEHDRFRGQEGAHARTLAGIRLALRRGLNVTLGAVVTHQTLHGPGISGLVDLASELRVILYLILPVPAGRWSGQDDFLLTDDDVAFVDGLTRRSPWVRTDFQANLGGYGCGAAKEILYLTPYGDVLACPFLHVAFGNVLEEPLAAIRARAMTVPDLAGYAPKCLVSTDRRFIERHLSKTFDAPRRPVPWRDVFPPGPAGPKEDP
jgi:MoaA/NifB/PqqE/SkfB family radical SAM enzyme